MEPYTMIGYFLAVFPLYIFVYLPLSQVFYGPPQSSSHHDITFNESFIAPEEPIPCAPYNFSIHILSREPLVIYISSFLSNSEITHLLEISKDKFAPSTVSTGPDTKLDTTVRHSEVAALDRDDVVKCIENRARAIQGWRPNLHIERLKIQRYGVGGHYAHHYDWRGAGKVDRVSSFMVYVDANCTGGGTGFPRLKRPGNDARWCEFIECEDGGAGQGEGVVFRPLRGNAVFWENLRADGTGYEETWHAGLPVVTGTKMGLNIWSWYQFSNYTEA